MSAAEKGLHESSAPTQLIFPAKQAFHLFVLHPNTAPRMCLPALRVLIEHQPESKTPL